MKTLNKLSDEIHENAKNKEMKTLNKLSDEIHENAKNKGFWDNPRETGTLLMLCVSELAEAMEADRKGKFAKVKLYEAVDQIGRPSHDAFSFESTIKDTFEDELADTIIRILDLCGAKGIDIEKHIELKMKYNATRERMHGKKY
jgi:NTP pyrophosphatase (non-canonical NTP hydrolase)